MFGCSVFDRNGVCGFAVDCVLFEMSILSAVTNATKGLFTVIGVGVGLVVGGVMRFLCLLGVVCMCK
jgi:hypothetical protein